MILTTFGKGLFNVQSSVAESPCSFEQDGELTVESPTTDLRGAGTFYSQTFPINVDVPTDGILPITMSVASEDIDTYMFLLDTDGETVILENDDYTDSNSRIDYSFEVSGVYYVLLTSYDAEATGAFHLSIDCQTPFVPAHCEMPPIVWRRTLGLDADEDIGHYAAYAQNDGRLFFGRESSVVVVVDASTSTKEATLTLGGYAINGILWNEATDKIYALHQQNSGDNVFLLTIDPTTLSPDWAAPGYTDLGGEDNGKVKKMALDTTHNRIYYWSDNMNVGYYDCNTLTTSSLGKIFGVNADYIQLFWSPINESIYGASVASGFVWQLDTSTNTVPYSASITTERVEGMYFCPNNDLFYVPTENGATWKIFNPSTNTIVSSSIATLANQRPATGHQLRATWQDCVDCLVWSDTISASLSYYNPSTDTLTQLPINDAPSNARSKQPIYTPDLQNTFVCWVGELIKCT